MGLIYATGLNWDLGDIINITGIEGQIGKDMCQGCKLRTGI